MDIDKFKPKYETVDYTLSDKQEYLRKAAIIAYHERALVRKIHNDPTWNYSWCNAEYMKPEYKSLPFSLKETDYRTAMVYFQQVLSKDISKYSHIWKHSKGLVLDSHSNCQAIRVAVAKELRALADELDMPPEMVADKNLRPIAAYYGPRYVQEWCGLLDDDCYSPFGNTYTLSLTHPWPG